jgi:hypothetical protein
LRLGVFETPRPVPGRVVPALAGAAVIALALPVFLVAGWPLGGWALAAVLWVAGELLAALLARFRLGAGNLASSGVVGIGMSFRVLAIGVVLIAVAASDARLGVSAALLYALAYTLELAVSLLSYFSQGATQT